MTVTIEVDKYHVTYFSKHPLASASISFTDGEDRLRGAIWFYNSTEDLPEDELMQDEEGLPYFFGYSTMDHFQNILELVRTERVYLKGSPDHMWLETSKEPISGVCDD